MHFSIPDTREFYNESTGSTYTGYNIYINDGFHCCLRYKQLHSFHEQLRRHVARCSDVNLPQFPPKKLLPLTNAQVESRRAALEHYLQLIGQDAILSKLELFYTFLLNAQHETAATEALEAGQSFALDCSVDVVLMNGYQMQLKCSSNTNSTALLHKACDFVNLPQSLWPYFCLYLMRKDAKDTLVLLRRLAEFEAPYISQQYASPCQIVLRKSYWDIGHDAQLLQDSIGINLLYIQTVSDVEHEWVIASPEMRKQLRALKECGKKREYVDLARQLPLYGCVQFIAASVDYPDETQKSAPAVIAIGNKELSMRTFQGAKIYETKFRVTRMRCWRVTTHQHGEEELKRGGGGAAAINSDSSNLQLSFEYLMSKQLMRWITINSPQAMLMSVCLQSLVDELLRQKDSILLEPRLYSIDDGYGQQSPAALNYVLRDGSGAQTIYAAGQPNSSIQQAERVNLRRCSAAYGAPTPKTKQKNGNRRNSAVTPLSATNSTSSTAIVFFRNIQESVHNEAFEEIGDEDL